MNYLKSERGSTLLTVLITAGVFLVVVTTGLRLHTARLQQNKIVGNMGLRNTLAGRLDQAIRDPAILNASVFDQSCLSSFYSSATGGSMQWDKVYGTISATNPVPNCLITIVGGDAVHPPATDPNAADAVGYAPFDLKTMNGAAVNRIAGTFDTPVYYNEMGEACSSPSSSDCTLEAIAVFRYLAAGGAAHSGPTFDIKYILRPKGSATGAATMNVKTFKGEAEVPLDVISRVSNPNDYYSCRDPASAWQYQPGSVMFSVAQDSTISSVNPDTGHAHEKPVCESGLGASLCPHDQWLLGVNTDGTAICGGKKTKCPRGSVPVGTTTLPDGGITMNCMPADCGAVVDASGVTRVGFVAPSSTDSADPAAPVNCLVVKPKAACVNRAGTFIRSTVGGGGVPGNIDCDTTTLNLPPLGGVAPPAPPPIPTPPTDCAATTLTWNVGTYSCSAAFPTTATFGSATQPANAPNTGSATYNCFAGTWVGPTAGATCTGPSACTAVTFDTANLKFCADSQCGASTSALAVNQSSSGVVSYAAAAMPSGYSCTGTITYGGIPIGLNATWTNSDITSVKTMNVGTQTLYVVNNFTGNGLSPYAGTGKCTISACDPVAAAATPTPTPSPPVGCDATNAGQFVGSVELVPTNSMAYTCPTGSNYNFIGATMGCVCGAGPLGSGNQMAQWLDSFDGATGVTTTSGGGMYKQAFKDAKLPTCMGSFNPATGVCNAGPFADITGQCASGNVTYQMNQVVDPMTGDVTSTTYVWCQ